MKSIVLAAASFFCLVLPQTAAFGLGAGLAPEVRASRQHEICPLNRVSMQLSAKKNAGGKKKKSKPKPLVIAADDDDDWDAAPEIGEVKDANGVLLSEGDSVVVTQDLDPKGAQKIKRGLKIKNIHMVPDMADAVECKTDQGVLVIKTCYLKKN